MIMPDLQYVSERLVLWFAKILINPVLCTVIKSQTPNINCLPLLRFLTSILLNQKHPGCFFALSVKVRK